MPSDNQQEEKLKNETPPVVDPVAIQEAAKEVIAENSELLERLAQSEQREV